MVRLTRLRIRAYQGVQGTVDLRFGPEHVFVLGSNGSGKSTLLNLLATLVAGDLAALRDEGRRLDVAWEMQASAGAEDGAVHTLWQRLRVEPAPVAGSTHGAYRVGGVGSQPWTEPLPSLASWTYEATHKRPRDGAEATFRATSDGEVSATPRFPLDEAVRRLFQPSFLAALAFGAEAVDPGSPWVGATLFTPHRRDRLRRFAEDLSDFHAVVDGGPDGARWLHDASGLPGRYLPAVLEGLLLRGAVSGRDVPAAISLKHPVDPDHADGPSGAVASLTLALPELLGSHRVDLTPRLARSEAGRSEWRGFDVHVHWPGSVIHAHDQLSFGQKRLLAFLWYAGVFTHQPLLTDELANGLHPAWVRRIADLVSGQQAIHALQNPLLLDWVGPADAADLASDFILCSVDVIDGRRVWTWRNPTATEAERLAEAWRAGFRNLSSILESEGWL